jgi:hypothetical protein
VGRALMSGAVSLVDALAVCKQPDTHAEFL